MKSFTRDQHPGSFGTDESERLRAFLAENEPRYDQQRMLCLPAETPGYHSRIASGRPVHPTRETMDYALALLQSDDPGHGERACDVIERVVALQVTDPTAEHYGIWGWFLEEPPQQMAPADWNWAEFIGARLAQVLIVHGNRLRAQTARLARSALQHAALAVFRRNVNAGYTNIAIMGGITAAAAGEVLGLPFLLDYGRARLRSVVKLAEEIGGFSEYNSPTYTRVAMEEAERGLLLLTDLEARTSAERLRILAWETIAGHFHPGTGQIAGPQSRAYSDRILPPLVRYLSEQTGVRISSSRTGSSPAANGYLVVPALPCPAHLAGRFSELPTDPLETVNRFGKTAFGDRIGTSYLTREMTLGSVNHDYTWIQRRPLLGYWRSDAEPVMVLRARLLKDGRDFASAYTWQAQRGPRVLSAWCFCSEAGDFHPTLDRRSDATYPMSDLQLRLTLEGRGATVKILGDGRFALIGGDWQCIVHTAPGRFEAKAIEWNTASDGDLAWVGAELYHGPERPLDCRITPLVLGCGIEVIRVGASATVAGISLDNSDPNRQRWTWNDLSVAASVAPVPFTW